MSKHRKSDKVNIHMLMLAIYPILNLYYFANTSLYLPQIITVLLVFYSIFKVKPALPYIPLAYILCWGYIAFHDLFFVTPFKITKLLPGGVNFCLFSVGWIMFANNYDVGKLRKYVYYVFVVAATLFLYQNIAYYILGQSTSVILPLSNNINYGDFTFSSLQLHQKYNFNGRFSSLFAEPSYWAQYCIITLCLELFCDENIGKLYTKKAVIISIVLLSIQSGVGVLCLGLIGVIKLWQVIFINKDKSKIGYLVIAIPFIIYALYLYISSDIGQGLVERGNNISNIQGEGSRSAFLRLFYGWEYLATLPVDQLLFGAREVIGMSSDDNTFFNCITYFILLHGIVGFTFLFLFYCSKAKKSVLSAAAALILLAISLMEAIYLNPTMLICTVIIAGVYNKNSK